MFFRLTNMSNIPDSVNINELSELLSTAPQEDDIHAEVANKDKELTPEMVINIAEKIIEDSAEEYKSPVVHKAIAVGILRRMIHWHTAMGKEFMDEGQEKTAVAWLRDAGKFQAVLDILYNIGVDDNDFLIQD